MWVNGHSAHSRGWSTTGSGERMNHNSGEDIRSTVASVRSAGVRSVSAMLCASVSKSDSESFSFQTAAECFACASYCMDDATLSDQTRQSHSIWTSQGRPFRGELFKFGFGLLIVSQQHKFDSRTLAGSLDGKVVKQQVVSTLWRRVDPGAHSTKHVRDTALTRGRDSATWCLVMTLASGTSQGTLCPTETAKTWSGITSGRLAELLVQDLLNTVSNASSECFHKNLELEDGETGAAPVAKADTHIGVSQISMKYRVKKRVTALWLLSSSRVSLVTVESTTSDIPVGDESSTRQASRVAMDITEETAAAAPAQ